MWKFCSFMGILFLAAISFLIYAGSKGKELSEIAQEISKEMGCEYLGSARDLPNIKFLDCNGEIKLIRVRLK